MADELWNQAETYHGAGLCVIPLKPRSKEPAIMSWKPYQERPPDASERWEWFGEHPDRNIAIVCGKVSGGVDGLSLAVVDFDEGEAYRAWTETHLRLVRSTPIVKTAHGHHVYLRTGESTRCFPIEGGDVKGMGGYVVAPPSIHSDTGTPYELISGDFSSIAVVESLSAIGIEPKRQVRARARRAESWLTEALQGVEEGQRNNTATRLAGYWRSLGMPDDVILAQLLLWNERNRPPLPDSELETIAQSIGHYAPGREEEPATEPPMREEAEGKAEQKPRKKSQAELMVELALDRNITLFLDQSDEPCAQFPIDDHQEIATIASRRFRWWLRGLLFQAYGKPGYHEAVESAVSVLSSMAAFDNPRHYRLWNRVAWGADGDLWYDLADSKWRAVQIAADGWRSWWTSRFYSSASHTKRCRSNRSGCPLVRLPRSWRSFGSSST